MCSSPKAGVTSRSKTIIAAGSTQLSSTQQAQYAAKANAAWERRELRRWQCQASESPVQKEPGLLEKLWQRLVKSDTEQTTNHSHSAQ